MIPDDADSGKQQQPRYAVRAKRLVGDRPVSREDVDDVARDYDGCDPEQVPNIREQQEQQGQCQPEHGDDMTYRDQPRC